MCDIIFSPEQTHWCCLRTAAFPIFMAFTRLSRRITNETLKRRKKGNFPLHLSRLSEALRNPPPVSPAPWQKKLQRFNELTLCTQFQAEVVRKCGDSQRTWKQALDIHHIANALTLKWSALLVARKVWWTCFRINYAEIMHAKPSNEREHSKSTSQGLGPNSVWAFKCICGWSIMAGRVLAPLTTSDAFEDEKARRLVWFVDEQLQFWWKKFYAKDFAELHDGCKVSQGRSGFFLKK